MKEFRTKIQSIFPAIPKNSESTVEWEDLLKSKWKNQKHLEMALSARTEAEAAEMSHLNKREKKSDWARYWLSSLNLGMPANHLSGKRIKIIYFFSVFGMVDLWQKGTFQGKLVPTWKKTVPYEDLSKKTTLIINIRTKPQ